MPLVVFGVVYVLLFEVGVAIAGAFHMQQLIPLLAAPLAVLAARRFGPLSRASLLVLSILLAALTYTATWAIFHVVAIPANGSVPFSALATTGGWSWVATTLSFALSPVAWSYFDDLGRQQSRGAA